MTMFTIFAVTLSVGCHFHFVRDMPTVDGPEAKNLVAKSKGIVLLPSPPGGIKAIYLPNCRPVTIRSPRRDGCVVDSLSGADDARGLVFLEECLRKRTFALKYLAMSGFPEEVLLQGKGSPLWDKVVDCRYLSFASSTDRVAIIRNLVKIQLRNPSRRIEQGELCILDRGTKAEKRTGIRVLSRPVAWMPDGVRVVCSRLVRRDKALSLKGVNVTEEVEEHWNELPVVSIINTDTLKIQDLCVSLGGNQIPTPDGRVLVRTVKGWWEIDPVEMTSQAVVIPGAVGAPLGWSTNDLIVYIGLPTTGQRIGMSGAGNWFVGRYHYVTLKIADIKSGEFQTIARDIDPRSVLSFCGVKDKDRDIRSGVSAGAKSAGDGDQ